MILGERKEFCVGRYLVMYDLSGIQSFIFSTNRVKEIVGASYLVSKALFGNVPRLLDEPADAWKAYDPSDFESLGYEEGRTVYIGGGNALVLFGSASAATTFTKRLKREVFLQTGGALRVCSARMEVSESTRLRDCLDPANETGLRAMLDRSKAKAPHALTARGFSIDALDNDTQEPIVFFPRAIMDQGAWHKLMSRTQRLKLQAYEAQHNARGHAADSSPLLQLMHGRKYEVEADKFFDESEYDQRGKHFLAVVHIDGNTMGQRISRFLGGLAEGGSLAEDLVAMRDLSAFISGVYQNALSRTIEDVFGPATEQPLAFRPVVADGDDITFVCRSEDAFACVDAFVRALHAPGGEPARADLPKPKDLSVGAGIAFIKSGYPFSSGYAMAEELCGNAKKCAIQRFGQMPACPVSSVDFHVCSGELVVDVEAYRKCRLTLVGSGSGKPEARLCVRPYYIVDDESCVGERELLFDSFVSQIRELLLRSEPDQDERDVWIARSKLKGLRDKYGQGVEQARRYGELVCERNVALQRMGAKGENARAEFVEAFRDPFVSLSAPENGETTLYARFFDALDVMDLCEGVRAEEVEAQ